MKTVILPHRPESIEKAQNFIQTVLRKYKADDASVARTLLATEEVLARLTTPGKARPADAAEDAPCEMTVGVRNLLGELEVIIRGWGEAFSVSDLAAGLPAHEASDDPDVQEVIRNAMSKLLGGRVTVRCTRGRISVSIIVKKSPKRQLYLTLLGLGLGIVAGVLVRILFPPHIQMVICDNLFDAASTIFLNAIKLVVTPLILFSIASSLSEFGDMKALGRVGGRMFLVSMFTCVVALFTGLLAYKIFPIGNPLLKASVVASEAAETIVHNTSALSANIVDTIVRIVPVEIISPVQNGDMLQVIFIAVLLGIAAAKTGEWSTTCRNGLQALNALFSKATAMIINVMPIAIFCSMAKTVINVDVQCILSLLSWPVVNVLGFGIQFVFYGLLILVVGRISPFPFYRKFSNAILMAISLCSSNATIPFSMETCDKKLGISHKVYAFSIPVGQAVNMNGSSISIIISSLFMAKIYGVAITPSMIFAMCMTVFVLCIGTPGIPGSALVSIAVVLPQLGIPAEAVSIIMGLYPVAGMVMSGVNVAGNAAVTTVVASLEGLLDRTVYNE